MSQSRREGGCAARKWSLGRCPLSTDVLPSPLAPSPLAPAPFLPQPLSSPRRSISTGCVSAPFHLSTVCFLLSSCPCPHPLISLLSVSSVLSSCPRLHPLISLLSVSSCLVFLPVSATSHLSRPTVCFLLSCLPACVCTLSSHYCLFSPVLSSCPCLHPLISTVCFLSFCPCPHPVISLLSVSSCPLFLARVCTLSSHYCLFSPVLSSCPCLHPLISLLSVSSCPLFLPVSAPSHLTTVCFLLSCLPACVCTLSSL